ncbi:hypothetical protein DVH24_020308 [Malus domestica]|uniref:Uncharacterized protein n=1 Tax=Malus domestica TaxID=3750 RepID=A0A498J8Y4_MALDO|nr:hypothetical protein DVH24_020308 [Malus domestica]
MEIELLPCLMNWDGWSDLSGYPSPEIPLPATIGSLRNNISLHGNPISMDQFQQMEGFQEFEARRKQKLDKQIDSNVMISSKGLDEGVDL